MSVCERLLLFFFLIFDFVFFLFLIVLCVSKSGEQNLKSETESFLALDFRQSICIWL